MTNYHPFKSIELKEEYMALNKEIESYWPIPYDCKTITTSYGQTFVRINGPIDAPPLVLLSGALSCSLQWLPNIEILSKHFRTYAIDSLINTGSVGRSAYTKTIKNHIEAVSWLDELFIALSLEKNINIIGMSYGGWLTSKYALKYPQKLNKIVLLAPAILPVSLKFILHAIPAEFNKSYKSIKRFLDWHLDIKTSKDKKVLEMIINIITVSKLCFEETNYPMFSELKNEELKKIVIPTYLLIGKNDKSYSIRRGINKIKKAVPNWEIEILPKASHALPIDQAGVVNRKVLEFLA